MDFKVAFLVDGSFYLKRLSFFKRKYYGSKPDLDPQQVVQLLNRIVKKHIESERAERYQHLYRVFFYDAPSLDIKAHYPLKEHGETNFRAVDFSKAPEMVNRKAIIEELKKQRKVALRLGHIKHDKQWKLSNSALNRLLKGEIQFNELTNDDFYYSMRQKGVDIKLGIDIATLSQEKLVDKIVLIAGDSDFVPAAKLARTSGIDFVLDALRNNIDQSLHEHIDGLISFDLVSILKEILRCEPDERPTWWNDGPNPKTPKHKKTTNKRKSKRRKYN